MGKLTNWSTKHYTENKRPRKTNPTKILSELRCSGRVISSSSNTGTSRVRRVSGYQMGNQSEAVMRRTYNEVPKWKRTKGENNDLQNNTQTAKDWATRTPGELRCCEMVRNSCSTSDTRRGTLVIKRMTWNINVCFFLFCWPLRWLFSFDLRLMISPLESSHFYLWTLQLTIYLLYFIK